MSTVVISLASPNLLISWGISGIFVFLSETVILRPRLPALDDYHYGNTYKIDRDCVLLLARRCETLYSTGCYVTRPYLAFVSRECVGRVP
jgi:hypothetical protein